jgi:hypothetical protein
MGRVKDAMFDDEWTPQAVALDGARVEDPEDDLDDSDLDDPDMTPLEDVNVKWWPETETGGES